MNYKVEYNGDLRTTALHIKSGEQVITDAPTDNNGQGRYFSPTDLTSASLASCMMTIVGISANNHGITIESMSAEVTKKMASNPRRIEAIQINLSISAGELDEKQKEILSRAAQTCPVAMSLHPDIDQDVQITF
ncbi:OsmC family protein [Sanyastnella coralliicola]|uniref:OsmC family protein n=1 Tax=Sanyastnella coralliicola TaxID=3069118 RepID=UPI0027BB1A6C|nr:OsmC family protein [Longitalea sp. SCSIO 12813]